MAEKCTNTSSPPSREMNPKPLLLLNHLTVPVIRSDIVFCSLLQIKNFFRYLLHSFGRSNKADPAMFCQVVFHVPTRIYRHPPNNEYKRYFVSLSRIPYVNIS